MKYKVTATFDAINEAMALVGIVDELKIVAEGEEDEDDV